jgi:DNA-directed RNA polymerase specialized sigma24 family protein
MDDDRRFVAEAQAGSRETVGRLFDRHWPGVWRAAYMVTGRHDLADDVAQDAFERRSGPSRPPTRIGQSLRR